MRSVQAVHAGRHHKQVNEVSTDGASMDEIACVVAAGYDKVMYCGDALWWQTYPQPAGAGTPRLSSHS